MNIVPKKSNKNKIKVSILCITYNQEKFIKQALDSFINQKTNFNFEVIIGDDYSKDNTPIIIKEFENKYPNIIKPIYRNKNIGISNNLFDILCKAKGQYISLCAGDDYFTNESKLQLQADFLDKNTDYSMCFHLTKVFFENNEEKEYIYPDLNKKNVFSTKELLRYNFIQASSVMYRKLIYKNLPKDIIPEDLYLHLYHSKFGKIGFINKVMSVYRKHKKSVWWNSDKNIDELIKKHGISKIKMFFELLKIFDNKEYKEIISNDIDQTLNQIIKTDKNNSNTKLVETLFKLNPKYLANYLITINDIKNLYQLELDQNQNLLKEISKINKEKEMLQVSINQIQLSKTYKIWQKYNQIKKFFKKTK